MSFIVSRDTVNNSWDKKVLDFIAFKNILGNFLGKDTDKSVVGNKLESVKLILPVCFHPNPAFQSIFFDQ